jgi:C4-dicarboxylate transporter DctM subunit
VIGLAMLASFFGLLAIGLPIAFGLATAGFIGILLSPGGIHILPVVPQEIYRALNSFPLLSIPLFVLAGTIMAEGGLAKRLMDLAQATVGRGRGGLPAATVVGTMMFSGISGSSTADTVAVGKVTLPALQSQGYPLPFSTALLAASGASATLVPPSIDLIIIGVVANISIAGLFAAGILPAMVNAIGVVLLVLIISRRRGYGIVREWPSLREFWTLFVRAIPALLMAVLVLRGIFSGVFTPTEASVIAVIYGFFVAAFVYRDLRMSMLPQILRSSIVTTGTVMLIVAASSIVAYAMTINQIPQEVAAALKEATSSRVLFLILVQITFLAVGMFMDGLPALLVAMPLLTPVAVSYGIDPIHFGILVEANIGIGLAHPPVGMCLFAACAVTRTPIEKVVRPLLPFLAVLITTMLIITYLPAISMFLPRRFGFAE